MSLLVFPLLFISAVHFLFRHIHSSALDQKLNAVCASPLFAGPYTGWQALDKNGICGLVVFFHTLLDSPTHLPLIPYFIATGAPYALLTIVNSYKRDRSSVLTYPTIWLLLTQFLSFGATYPIYSLLLIMSSKGRPLQPLRAFTKADAESLAFGLFVGGLLPSVAMVYLLQPFVTWIWQLYPVLIYLAQHIYLRLCSRSRHLQSGYNVMRALYISCFIISSITHFVIVLPRIRDPSAFKVLLIPSTTSLDPSTDIRYLVLYFLKWDLFLGYTAAALSTLWCAQSVLQVAAMVTWYVGASPLIGMGSSVMAFAIWRDGVLSPKNNQ